MSKRKSNWLNHPKILEINTWPWLTNLSDKLGQDVKLNDIPIDLLYREVSFFDVVWLMGVWERSPMGKEIAMNNKDLQQEYHKAIRYFSNQDVVGSPYAVYYYHVSSQLGGPDALKSLREDLETRGVLLILDYVPNHVSIDHLWTLEKSDVFIKGTLNDLMTKPYEYFSVGDRVYAHGRDPNFPPWTDTVQINAFSREARSKAVNTLLSIAQLCDGVRCDMAMLMTNSVFSKTWGEKAGSPLEKEYWDEIISTVKEKNPDFKFIAEVYWDMERDLIQQGFDYCYDKKLYDYLKRFNADNIRSYLEADLQYQSKLLRFIENHDEPRAITVFGHEASKAASVIATTLPGAILIYEGQTRGSKIKLPVQLNKGPIEEVDEDMVEHYNNLLRIIPGREYNNAMWSLCEVKPVGPDDISYHNIISYQWLGDNQTLLIVVNYSSILSKAHIILNDISYETFNWRFIDLLNKNEYTYKGENLSKYGLYVELDSWRSHIFRVEKIQANF
jgi:glycosidase